MPFPLQSDAVVRTCNVQGQPLLWHFEKGTFAFKTKRSRGGAPFFVLPTSLGGSHSLVATMIA